MKGKVQISGHQANRGKSRVQGEQLRHLPAKSGWQSTWPIWLWLNHSFKPPRPSGERRKNSTNRDDAQVQKVGLVWTQIRTLVYVSKGKREPTISG
jgi:hypothetical protein